MKTLININEQVIRVSDKRAQELLATRRWSLCAKRFWKNLIRDFGKTMDKLK